MGEIVSDFRDEQEIVAGFETVESEQIANIDLVCEATDWPAPGSEDTELGVLMELEVRHGEASVYAGVQA